jgi:hypothetical protein
MVLERHREDFTDTHTIATARLAGGQAHTAHPITAQRELINH